MGRELTHDERGNTRSLSGTPGGRSSRSLLAAGVFLGVQPGSQALKLDKTSRPERVATPRSQIRWRRHENCLFRINHDRIGLREI